jgi:hypothetical protein
MSKTAALVKVGLTSGNRLERVTRIELAWPAWKEWLTPWPGIVCARHCVR